MIITLTLNPCIDRTVSIPGFVYGGTNRIARTRQDVSGKGINVSVALRHLQMDTVCLGFCYREQEALMEQALDAQGIAHDLVRVEGGLRMNFKVFDESRKVMTEFNERGAAVDESAAERVLEKIRQYLGRAELIVLTGSVPDGVPDDIYETIICMAREKGVRAVLDASGPLLEKGLRARPFLVKPNLDEFREMFREKLDAGMSVQEIAEETAARGVEYVCVSMGADGALLAGADGVWRAGAPDVDVRGIQGAGDSLVAGICYALARGASGEEMLRCATAAAGASLMLPGTQMCRLEDFLALRAKIRVWK